jgi:hypothetical protein
LEQLNRAPAERCLKDCVCLHVLVLTDKQHKYSDNTSDALLTDLQVRDFTSAHMLHQHIYVYETDWGLLVK